MFGTTRGSPYMQTLHVLSVRPLHTIASFQKWIAQKFHQFGPIHMETKGQESVEYQNQIAVTKKNDLWDLNERPNLKVSCLSKYLYSNTFGEI